MTNESAPAYQTRVASYYGELRALVRDGRIGEAIEQLDQAPSLGIRPSDLMVGLVQPFIAWLAGFWASAQFHPEYERQVVDPLTLLLERLATRYPELGRYRNVEKPAVLFLSTGGSTPAIGLQIVEFGLATRAVSSKVIVQGMGLEAVRQQLLQHQPLTVAFTVSTDEQLMQTEELVVGLRVTPALAKLKFLVGGLVVRQGRVIESKVGLVHCRSALDILRHIDLNEDARLGYPGVFMSTEPTRRRPQVKSTVT
jgi:hypothetical protein